MEEPDLINGLNMKEFEEAVKLVGEQEGARRAPKKSRIRWQGASSLVPGSEITPFWWMSLLI